MDPHLTTPTPMKLNTKLFQPHFSGRSAKHVLIFLKEVKGGRFKADPLGCESQVGSPWTPCAEDERRFLSSLIETLPVHYVTWREVVEKSGTFDIAKWVKT